MRSKWRQGKSNGGKSLFCLWQSTFKVHLRVYFKGRLWENVSPKPTLIRLIKLWKNEFMWPTETPTVLCGNTNNVNLTSQEITKFFKGSPSGDPESVTLMLHSKLKCCFFLCFLFASEVKLRFPSPCKVPTPIQLPCCRPMLKLELCRSGSVHMSDPLTWVALQRGLFFLNSGLVTAGALNGMILQWGCTAWVSEADDGC